MVRKKAVSLPLAPETEWLGRVREVRHAIDPSHPLRVSHRRITDEKRFPHPTTPYPERHPYCEVVFLLEGRGEQFFGAEKQIGKAGDMTLVGPGVPHYGTILKCPHHGIVVHFLPVLLFEMSPNDGARLLTRFTASQSISQRVVRTPKPLQAQFAAHFITMAEEFDHPKLGSDLCVRLLLMDVLIKLLRWEESAGRALPNQRVPSSWFQIEKTLHFIYQHYTEPLYIEQIAHEVGLSVKNLRRLFHDAFGMSCIQYLSAYRISHATSLLCLPGARVTEVAPAVGFETLSHFNSAFNRSQGMSPTEYIRSRKPAE